eukprot:scaffold396115_cov28-Prasinocladus_malaysianus.AAC.1
MLTSIGGTKGFLAFINEKYRKGRWKIHGGCLQMPSESTEHISSIILGLIGCQPFPFSRAHHLVRLLILRRPIELCATYFSLRAIRLMI